MMVDRSHNGGPPLIDDDDEAPKLRWVKVNIAEALEGMEDLTMEERGFCWTGWLKMYARMGGLPADEHVGARIMGCDIRLYRRLCRVLVGEGAKFYVEDGLIKNSRVEREIAAFCREHKRRRDAALEREAKRRLQVRSGELPGDFSQTSPRLLPEVSNMFTAQEAKITETSSQKPNEINVRTATTVPQQKHGSPGTRTTNQNQEPEREESTTTVEQAQSVGGGGHLDALNGTAVDIIAFIGRHAMVDPPEATRMLANNVKAFTADAMMEAYSATIAEMAGGLIARPYKYLIETARRIKDGRTRRAPPTAEAVETKDAKRSAAVRDAMAKAEVARGMRRNG
jgi:hypothetical protein